MTTMQQSTLSPQQINHSPNLVNFKRCPQPPSSPSKHNFAFNQTSTTSRPRINKPLTQSRHLSLFSNGNPGEDEESHGNGEEAFQ
jgi:hypothetical protein